MIKRVFDCTVSALGLVLLSPVFLCIAILIKIHDGGSIFYQAARIGKNGKPFRMFKFRTLVVNAEELGGTSISETDTRITTIGQTLRKYKLDELPQLLNVLAGDMSLVGPRPEVEEYTRLYSEKERVILSVLPGITDWASVRFRHLNAILAATPDPDGFYKRVILPEKNKLRVEYALSHTFWMDIQIIAATIKALGTSPKETVKDGL